MKTKRKVVFLAIFSALLSLACLPRLVDPVLLKEVPNPDHFIARAFGRQPLSLSSADYYDSSLFGIVETLAHRSLPNESLNIGLAFERMRFLGIQRLRLQVWRDTAMVNSTSINTNVTDAINHVSQEANSSGIAVMGYAEDFPNWMTNITGDLRAIPHRKTTEYNRFLDLYEESWETLAREFPEIMVWEIGNEYNLHQFLHPPSGDFDPKERECIVTDLLYYGSRGIKLGNSNATTVMGGLGPLENSTYGNGIYDIRDFLNSIYVNIESGNWSSTDPDDFFEVACWHPYTFNEKPNMHASKPNETNWVIPNQAVFEIMENHADGDKRVVFSEMGYSDNNTSSHYAPREEIPEYLTSVFTLSETNFPWLDTIYWYRLADRDGRYEDKPPGMDGYGLFEYPTWDCKPAAYAYKSLVDTTPPNILILSPENETFYLENNVSLTFRVDEPTDWIGYSLNGEASVTISGNTTLTDLSDGEYDILVYANDTAGNMGASAFTVFWVDTTPPTMGYVSQTPPQDNVLPENDVMVTAWVTDNLGGWPQANLNYTTNNGTWFTTPMTWSGGINWTATIPQFPYCTNVTYIVIAEDDAGNTVTSEELGHNTQYHVIPEFPSFLILSLFMIATLLAAMVYGRKHSIQC